MTYLCVGTVAIKVATGIGSTFDAIHDPVWREAEVSGAKANGLTLPRPCICAAMMSMQHKCLVKFLGAGVMSEPIHGLRVLFNVQVAINDTILLFACLQMTELRVVAVHRSSCQAAH